MAKKINEEVVSHDDHEHHVENFWTKYVFSMDHKMIGKQFLITGMLMGVLGVFLSMLFRLQLAWPNEKFVILESILGKWAPEGQMDPNIYLALVTIHGTIMVFFCVDSRPIWNIFKSLNSFANWS
jgi:cytochrome c oxidase subunit 1